MVRRCPCSPAVQRSFLEHSSFPTLYLFLMRMVEGHAASMQFIQTFLESSVKVIAAISRVAVPASPDAATGPAARAAGGCWLGRAAPPGSCTELQPQSPVLLATCPPSHIARFCLCSPAAQEEAQKMQFLQTISTLSKAARDEGFSQELKEFYHQFQVAENIKVGDTRLLWGRGQVARRRHTVRTHRAHAGGGQGPTCAGRR